MEIKDSFQPISQIILQKRGKKPPAYEWQALALRVIDELRIPGFKRSAVFKVCKALDKKQVEQCLIDTKELAKSGQTWQYFFKLADQLSKNSKPIEELE